MRLSPGPPSHAHPQAWFWWGPFEPKCPQMHAHIHTHLLMRMHTCSLAQPHAHARTYTTHSCPRTFTLVCSPMHTGTHARARTPIRTLARTHTHTHPFAHRRAPLTASVAFRGGGKGRVPPGVHTCGRPFACPLPHGGPPVPAPGGTSACDSVSHPLFPGHPAQCLAGAGPPRVPASEVERGRAQGPAWGGEGHVEGGLSGGGAALRDGGMACWGPLLPLRPGRGRQRY